MLLRLKYGSMNEDSYIYLGVDLISQASETFVTPFGAWSAVSGTNEV